MHIVMVRRWIGILNLLGLACGVIGGGPVSLLAGVEAIELPSG
jgi:hypothetical protein